MKRCFSILFILFSLQSGAQKIRFTDTSNRWYIKTTAIDWGGGAWDVYYADTIVTVDSFDYLLMLSKTRYNSTGGSGYINPVALLREDTIAQKVYIRTYPPTQQAERILYDYSLQPGDTVKAPGIPFVHTLAGIDTLLINGVAHRVYYFQSTQALNNGYQVIEGIGCPQGLEYPFNPQVPFEGRTELLCFTHNGTKPPLGKKFGKFDNTTSCLLSIKDNNPQNNYVTIYPQPAGSSATIQLGKLQTGSICIYNNLGQIVSNKSIANQDRIEIGNPGTWNGMYYYRITDNTENKVYSGKLLFE